MKNTYLRTVLFSPWTPLFIAFFFRMALLGHESLWNDEVVTIVESAKPVETIISRRWDPHPPLYYLFLHYWLLIGRSDAFTRFPSVIFGVVSILFIYLIGIRLATRRIAWFMALLLAVSPLHIWYSQETRMYALVAMWALASTFFWILLLQTHYHRFGVWLGFIIVTSLGLYTHYTMLMIVIGQNIYTVANWVAQAKNRRDYPLGFWFFSQAALVLLYAPWFSELPKHWGVIRASTDYPMWILSTTPALIGGGLVGLLFFILLAACLRQSIDLPDLLKRRMITIVVAISMFLFWGFLVLAMTNRLSTLKRQTLVLFPFLYIFLVYILPHRVKKWRQWIVGMVVISVIVAAINLFTLQKPHWRDAVVFVQNQVAVSDAVVLNPPWIKMAFNYYLQQNSSTDDAASFPQLEKIPLSQEYQAVWLITNTKFEQWEDPDFGVRNGLMTDYEPVSPVYFGELEVISLKKIGKPVGVAPH
ncbi:MAG: hypothetical protein GY803_23500 [Chloroflexi bacterium]|nr:hypothetical protein [Chloroflexota bacterium]